MWDIISISADSYRVSDLEAGTGLESLDDLPIQASGIEGEIQLVRDSQQLQLHFRANFLLNIKLSTTHYLVSCIQMK